MQSKRKGGVSTPKQKPVPPVRRNPRSVARSRKNRSLGPVLAPGQPPPVRGLVEPADVGVQSAWTRITPKTGITSGFNVNVVKTEIFFNITTGAVGETYSYWTLNPANDMLTPWLCTIAPNFEQFYYNKLTVEYIPTCNYIATGTVTLAFLYDAVDTSVPNTMMALSQYEGAVTSPVRTPCVATFDRRRCQFQKWMILANGAYTVDRTSVPAYFEFAISGATPDTSLGQLRISYDIALCNAQYPEKPLSLHSSRVNYANIGWPYLDDIMPNPSAINTIYPNVPGWITYDGMNGFTVRGVDELNLTMTGTTTVVPYGYSVYGTGAGGYLTTHLPIDVVGTSGVKLSNVNDFEEIITTYGNNGFISMFIDFRRPTGTGTNDWGFKITYSGQSHPTFPQDTITNFTFHIAEAVN